MLKFDMIISHGQDYLPFFLCLINPYPQKHEHCLKDLLCFYLLITSNVRFKLNIKKTHVNEVKKTKRNISLINLTSEIDNPFIVKSETYRNVTY